MKSKIFIFALASLVAISSTYCQNKTKKNSQKQYAVTKTDSEWKEILSPEAYDVLRNKGTEYAFSGKYNHFKEQGVFICAACGNELFDSKTKYDSKSGWPSFYQPIDKEAIDVEIDKSYGMVREEVVCSRCGGHLGHVFNDGPKPTGLRYCINSVSMDFKKE